MQLRSMAAIETFILFWLSLRSFILDPVGVTVPSLIELSLSSCFWCFFLSLCPYRPATWVLTIYSFSRLLAFSAASC